MRLAVTIALGIAFGVALIPFVRRLMQTLEKAATLAVRQAATINWKRVGGAVAALIIATGLVLLVRDITAGQRSASGLGAVRPDTAARGHADSEPYLLRSELCSDSAAGIVRQSASRARDAMADRVHTLSGRQFDSAQKVIAAVTWWESTCHRMAK